MTRSNFWSSAKFTSSKRPWWIVNAGPACSRAASGLDYSFIVNPNQHGEISIDRSQFTDIKSTIAVSKFSGQRRKHFMPVTYQTLPSLNVADAKAVSLLNFPEAKLP
jgi:hypothetical protein